MKKLITAGVAAAMLLGGAGVAAAQDYRHDGRDHRDAQAGQYDRQGQRSGWDHRQGGQSGWNSSWRRGGRIDRDNWSRGERVDWRSHHLRRPSRGYEWRQVNGRYVMAAVASGVIADIIMNSR